MSNEPSYKRWMVPSSSLLSVPVTSLIKYWLQHYIYENLRFIPYVYFNYLVFMSVLQTCCSGVPDGRREGPGLHWSLALEPTGAPTSTGHIPQVHNTHHNVQI